MRLFGLIFHPLQPCFTHSLLRRTVEVMYRRKESKMSTTAEKSGKKLRKGHLSHDLGIYVGKKVYLHKKKKHEKSEHQPDLPTEEDFYRLYDPYDIFGPFGPYWG